MGGTWFNLPFLMSVANVPSPPSNGCRRCLECRYRVLGSQGALTGVRTRIPLRICLTGASRAGRFYMLRSSLSRSPVYFDAHDQFLLAIFSLAQPARPNSFPSAKGGSLLLSPLRHHPLGPDFFNFTSIAEDQFSIKLPPQVSGIFPLSPAESVCGLQSVPRWFGSRWLNRPPKVTQENLPHHPTIVVSVFPFVSS